MAVFSTRMDLCLTHIDPDENSFSRSFAHKEKSMSSESRKLVYCSGPLFCPEEIVKMCETSPALQDAGWI